MTANGENVAVRVSAVADEVDEVDVDALPICDLQVGDGVSAAVAQLQQDEARRQAGHERAAGRDLEAGSVGRERGIQPSAIEPGHSS